MVREDRGRLSLSFFAHKDIDLDNKDMYNKNILTQSILMEVDI